MELDVVRVLVIDDSALVRQVLEKGLGMDPGIEVVGTASDPYQARDQIVKLRPDVLTLDVEMPRMDGVEFLRKLMPQYPLPTIMVSALAERGARITMDALEAGAVDFVTKPKSSVQEGLNQMMQELRTKIKIASTANVSHWKNKRVIKTSQESLAVSTDKVIAIGASTGGTEAIRTLMSSMPQNCPGMVIVQHMPPKFTELFAERLNKEHAPLIKEAKTGDRVMQGRVLIAPGSKHMQVIRRGGIYEVVCQPGELVSGHCPSVEVLFRSVARQVGSNALGVMLTGMGKDGAYGLLQMRKAGAYTLGQDEASSVVYGMPKVAFELGAVHRQVPIQNMAATILHNIKKMTSS